MNSVTLLKFNKFRFTRDSLPGSLILFRGAHMKNYYKKWRNLDDTSDIPKSTIENFTTAQYQTEKGWPYDCKPFKMVLEKDKNYWWCSCGWGHNQPMCDGTHQKHYYPITMKPLRFKVAETKEYWLCCCKQTKNRPFCDGSHRDPQIQDLCKNKVVATGG